MAIVGKANLCEPMFGKDVMAVMDRSLGVTFVCTLSRHCSDRNLNSILVDLSLHQIGLFCHRLQTIETCSRIEILRENQALSYCTVTLPDNATTSLSQRYLCHMTARQSSINVTPHTFWRSRSDTKAPEASSDTVSKYVNASCSIFIVTVPTTLCSTHTV